MIMRKPLLSVLYERAWPSNNQAAFYIREFFLFFLQRKFISSAGGERYLRSLESLIFSLLVEKRIRTFNCATVYNVFSRSSGDSEWRDFTYNYGAICVADFFRSKIVIFPQFSGIFKWDKTGKANDKFITSQSFLSSDVVSTSIKRKRRIILYGLVTRYGPQSVAQRKWFKVQGWMVQKFLPTYFFLFNQSVRNT